MTKRVWTTDDDGTPARWEEPSGGSLPSGWNLQAGAGSPVGSVTPTAKGALYLATTSGALYLAVGVTSADWVGVGGPTSDAMGVASSVVAILAAAAGQDALLTDMGAVVGSGNGAYWNYDGAVDGEQNWRVVTGVAGAHNLDFDKDGALTVDGSPVGGSQPSDRARYAFATPPADNDLVEWNPTPEQSSGRTLLDFTDPTAPVALIAGVYAFNAWFQGTQQIGKTLRLDFESSNNYGIAEQQGTLDGLGVQNPTFTSGFTCFLDVGDSVFLAVIHDVGAPYGTYRLYVQLISETT